MSYVRKSWKGAAMQTTVVGSLTGGSVSITVADGSTLPTGAAGPFVVTIDRGLATEEKVLIASRATNVLTVTTRGYDDTAAQAHSSGATVDLVLDSYTIDQANAMATTMTTAGDLIYKTITGSNADYGRIAIGAANSVLRSNGSVPSWGKIVNADITDTTITGAKLVNATVTETQLAASVAGAGLGGGAGTPLSVTVDNSTVEVNVDTLRVKASGITSTHLATDSVTGTQIAANAVGTTEIADDAVTAAKIAAGAVGALEIADGVITNTELAAGDFTNISNTLLQTYVGKAVASTGQSINTATVTAVTFTGTDIYDPGAMHDPGTNPTRVTIQRAGQYRFSAHVGFTGNATGRRNATLKRYNSSGVEQEFMAAQSDQASTDGNFLSLSGTCDGAVGDYILLEVSQTSGGALNTFHASGIVSTISWEMIRD